MGHYGGYEFVIDDEELIAEELEAFTSRGGRTSATSPRRDRRNPKASSNREGSRSTWIWAAAGIGLGYPKIVEERNSNELASAREGIEYVLVNEDRAGFIGEIVPAPLHQAARTRLSRPRSAQQRTGVASRRIHALGHARAGTDRDAQGIWRGFTKTIIATWRRRGCITSCNREEGVYLEVDNIGYLDYSPSQSGRQRRCARGGRLGDRVAAIEDICMTKHLKFNGGKGYGYLLEVFLPIYVKRVKEEGSTQCW